MSSQAHLFVYGTLMPGQAAYALLAPHVLDARPAWTAGRLYLLPAGYPGLVDRPDGRVHGQVLTLSEPAPWGPLDDYEGYDAEDPLRSLYVRRVRVVLVDGSPQPAHCYVIDQEAEGGIIAAGAQVVPGGRWSSGDGGDVAP